MDIEHFVGRRFGRLVVTHYLGLNGRHNRSWACLCDCGNFTATVTNTLTQGYKKSCGCLKKETNRSHGMTNTSEYRSWMSMKRRCKYPSDPSYKNYGGRGITICERWEDSFEAFYEDMGAKPDGKHTIDRLDPNGNYFPENCRWASSKQQAENKRRPKGKRLVTYKGTTLGVTQWANKLGLNFQTLTDRLNAGWSVERAFTTKPRQP